MWAQAASAPSLRRLRFIGAFGAGAFSARLSQRVRELTRSFPFGAAGFRESRALFEDGERVLGREGRSEGAAGRVLLVAPGLNVKVSRAAMSEIVRSGVRAA